jgi:hypothetical protein
LFNVVQNQKNSNIEVLDKFGEDILDFKDLKEAEKWWEAHGKEGRKERRKGMRERFEDLALTRLPPSPTPAIPRAGGS